LSRTAETDRLVEQMIEYYRARAPWHDDYMAYSDNVALESLLAPVVDQIGTLFRGLDVLEVACGTGNWTQVLARRARSVLATDVIEDVLTIARAKEYREGVVTFRAMDAYALTLGGELFGGAFAADWWSHVPRSRLGSFVEGLNSCLAPEARVAFVDMLRRDHPDLIPYRHDREGNAICRRTLPDGTTHDVVKNFPDREEVLGVLSGKACGVDYRDWPELGRWLVCYRTPGSPG
jgi:demethylmenaquinone methyltransferase/2-methoxy-6-polyprenyl-1,4-benzoquinol methylase